MPCLNLRKNLDVSKIHQISSKVSVFRDFRPTNFITLTSKENIYLRVFYYFIIVNEMTIKILRMRISVFNPPAPCKELVKAHRTISLKLASAN